MPEEEATMMPSQTEVLDLLMLEIIEKEWGGSAPSRILRNFLPPFLEESAVKIHKIDDTLPALIPRQTKMFPVDQTTFRKVIK